MQLPSPTSTWQAGKELFSMHYAQRAADKQKKKEKLTEAVTWMAKAKQIERQAASAGEADKATLLANAVGLQKESCAGCQLQGVKRPNIRRSNFHEPKDRVLWFRDRHVDRRAARFACAV